MSAQKEQRQRWRSWDGRIVECVKETKYGGWLVEEVMGPEVGRRYVQILKPSRGIGMYRPCR